MRTLFLAWQDPGTRSWYPVGRLTHNGGTYHFTYTRGAIEARDTGSFQPLEPFTKLELEYVSDELFPLFANRVPSRDRSDFRAYTEYLNLPQDQDDPIALLARSGGRRQTDSLEVFPCPDPDEQGAYHIHFFAHGLRHFPDASLERISRLQTGETLLLVHDFQNPHDPHALLLRTDNDQDDRYLVGFCPRYLLHDAFTLLTQCTETTHVSVERVNPPPAPLQLRLLCSLTATWPPSFRPFSSEAYQPIPAHSATRNANE